MDTASNEPARTTAWQPPFWLRKLHLVAREPMEPWVSMSAEDRLRLAFELMSFTLNRLHEQARVRGCTLSTLLRTYEESAARLRVRA